MLNEGLSKLHIYIRQQCVYENNRDFYVIWHLVMLIHTSALINACTKHFKSIQNNGEKTKKSQNAREGETTNSYA